MLLSTSCFKVNWKSILKSPWYRKIKFKKKTLKVKRNKALLLPFSLRSSHSCDRKLSFLWRRYIRNKKSVHIIFFFETSVLFISLVLPWAQRNPVYSVYGNLDSYVYDYHFCYLSCPPCNCCMVTGMTVTVWTYTT